MVRASKCRACGSSDLRHVLALGQTPLANELLPLEASAADAELFPLDLVRCASCSLGQLGVIVAPSRLFADYVYYTSFSDTMLAHSEELAEMLRSKERLGSGALGGELASNDGYLLQFFKRDGGPVLGIEPAANIAEYAENEKGIRTIPEFFTESLGLDLAN